jgi:Rod binding domain-containing protein
MSIEPVLSSSITHTNPSTTGSPKKDSPARIRQAATDFEALLLAQMLKSARETSGGGLTADGADNNEANSTMVELGEQQFAQALASSGGLGIAKMVVTGLAKNADR